MLSLSPPTLTALAEFSDLLARESSSALHVAWISPGPSDVYGPGDVIVGKWQSEQKVVSPSFRLCSGAHGGCGDTVWPAVAESAGSYVISV